jgi:glycosyltransferase involved in cell wall biosynthesis
MKVAIATVQVPFIQGGAEIHAQSLKTQLVARGHSCDIVSVPFKWYPPETLADCMMMGRMLDLTEVNGERIHVVIALKFPAYYTRHDNKVIWLLHQHRQAYDLWGTEFGDLHALASGERMRRLILEHDTRYLGEARGIFTISENVSRRLAQYNGLNSTPLYHPPASHDQYRCDGYEPFVFCPGRIDRMKRQRLVVEAARYLKSGMKIVIAGRGSESETDHLVNLIREHNLSNRVTLAGYISEEQKRDYYARCRAVFFGGYEEDYGYVPLEAFYAAKPVIALDDTGGALEFVEDKVNGFIAANQASAVAGRIDLLGEDANLAEKLGRAGARTLEEKRVNWDHVISSLLGAADA